MKTSTFIYRSIACILMICMFLTLVSCKGGSNDTPTEDPAISDDPNNTDNSNVKKIELTSNGKLNYTIVYLNVASDLNARAATEMQDFLTAQGISSEVVAWNANNPSGPKILIGTTEFLNEDSFFGIDLERTGINGFTVNVSKDSITLAADNDKALLDASEYFCENFLDVKNGKGSIPENHKYISSTGTFLSSLTLGGVDISKFSLSCDEGFEEPMNYIKELVLDKCGTSLSNNGEKKIILTKEGFKEDRVLAKFDESGNLIISAEDLKSMKKAVVCFWYEKIGHQTGSFDLPANTSYNRNLKKVVFYSDFKVKESDNECCFDKMIEAHNYANEHGYKVFADYGAQYYLASTGKTITIKTNVEWGNAKIMIDDSKVPVSARGNWIFNVPASNGAYNLSATAVKTLSRDMTNIGITLPQKSFVTFYDENTRHYIRSGGNADKGAVKVDNIVVNKDGSIDTDAPIMWDFDKITKITVRPIDEVPITISGGTFTTIANRAPSEGTYYARGINVSRSNTNIDSVEHLVIDESKSGAPYSGFFQINNCAYVTVKNCVASGQIDHKGAGSYDIGMGHTISVSFINCRQANDIHDNKYWGVTGTNYCKNFVYDGCILSRFDAHKGVTNAAIKNSIIGFAGANIIGYGTFIVEDSVFYSNKMLIMRDDYGASWEGDIIIKNSSVIPLKAGNVYIIAGGNKGNHDYGYECHMPTNITLDGLRVYGVRKSYIFANLNPNCKSDTYVPKYPHIPTEKVTVCNTDSEFILCENAYLLKDTEYIVE